MLFGTRRALLSRRAATAAFAGMFDAVESSLVHVWSPTCRVLTSYTGDLVRLRRTSDDAEANFSYTATGEIDYAAVAAWAGGEVRIVTLYDQIGGDNVTQATANNQPIFSDDVINGHGVGEYDGTSHCLQGAYTNGGALSQPFTIVVLADLVDGVGNDDKAYYLIDGDDGTNRSEIYKRVATTPDCWALYAGATLEGGASDDATHLFTMLFNAASSVLWVDGVQNAAGDAGTQNADGITIGAQNLTTKFWSGYIGTVAVFDSALSTGDRQVAEAALMDYYGIT